MSTIYTFTVFIESAGTTTINNPNIFGGNSSLGGHMWWRINAYEDGAPKTGAQRDAGFTSNGIVSSDNDGYTGNPAYTSHTVQISEAAYNNLKAFGTPGSRDGLQNLLERAPQDVHARGDQLGNLCHEAATEIRRLQALNDRLEEENRQLAEALGWLSVTAEPVGVGAHLQASNGLPKAGGTAKINQ